MFVVVRLSFVCCLDNVLVCLFCELLFAGVWLGSCVCVLACGFVCMCVFVWNRVCEVVCGVWRVSLLLWLCVCYNWLTSGLLCVACI